MTIKLHGLDHNLLTSYIDINGIVDIQKEHFFSEKIVY